MMKRWLAAFAVVVAAVSVPATASALTKEAAGHHLVAEGDLVRARAAVIAALGGDLSPEERASCLELMVVIERWSAVGTRPRTNIVKDDTPIPEGEDWSSSFTAAREALVAGRYRAAEVRFVALSQSAPDASNRARAEELAMLAHDIAEHDHKPLPTPAAQDAAKPEEGKKVEEWYGWETLICDGASIVTAPILVGIGGYLVCAPIVHAANGQGLKALASLGLRVGGPVVFAIAGGLIEAGATDCRSYCGLGGGIVGFGVGIVTAMVIDSAVLARKDVVKKTEKPTIVPTGNARADRLEFGIAGTF